MFNSWMHTGPHKIQTLCLRVLSKHSLNSSSSGPCPQPSGADPAHSNSVHVIQEVGWHSKAGCSLALATLLYLGAYLTPLCCFPTAQQKHFYSEPQWEGVGSRWASSTFFSWEMGIHVMLEQQQTETLGREDVVLESDHAVRAENKQSQEHARP